MNAYARCEDPEDIVFTLTLSATVAEWIKIGETLKSGSWTQPSEELMEHIKDLATQATQAFFSKAGH